VSPPAHPVRRGHDKRFPPPEDIVQYALLIYIDPEATADYSDEQRQALTAEYMDIRSDPRVVRGASLRPAETATTVRMPDATPLITDGPFSNTKEVFGGFFLLEADDIDAALEISQKVPALRMGGVVEIRPLM
jgi:hypothetical protein